MKHFEDCEQLFLSIGRCYTVEALVDFFNMETPDGHPTKNRPPYHVLDVGDNKEEYFESILEKFIDKYLITPAPETQANAEEECDDDFIRNYSVCLLKYFFLYADLKDAVKEGNGATLATLHKQLLPFFKSLPGFNAYAIEMFISIVQNEVLLSEAEVVVVPTRNLLLVLVLAPRGFSPGSPVFPSPEKPTFPNSNSIWNPRATGLSVISLLSVTLVK